MKQQRWEEQLKKQELLLWIEYALSTKTSDQARTEVRWRARQEASLAPQVWTCGHSEINVVYWRKYRTCYIFGTFRRPRSDLAPWDFCPLLLRPCVKDIASRYEHCVFDLTPTTHTVCSAHFYISDTVCLVRHDFNRKHTENWTLVPKFHFKIDAYNKRG